MLCGEHASPDTLVRLLATHGAWIVALLVAIESAGVPVPGETVLVLAAIYAGKTHHLSIAWVLWAAMAGAILGDNAGYLVGRWGGYCLLRRYGRRIRIDERRLKLGIYLFRRYGGKIVFFGRFVAVLRAWAAFLAGVNRMPYKGFLAANAAGAVVWVAVTGVAAYLLGEEAARIGRVLGRGLVALAGAGLIAAGLFIRRHEKRLEDEAERALPGPLPAGGKGGAVRGAESAHRESREP
jgi:membrane protein DedA with SNARE-associated domain